jgi:hypothetical protein
VGSEAFRNRFRGYMYGVIHRGDLYQVLLDACRAEKNIDLNEKLQKGAGDHLS